MISQRIFTAGGMQRLVKDDLTQTKTPESLSASSLRKSDLTSPLNCPEMRKFANIHCKLLDKAGRKGRKENSNDNNLSGGSNWYPNSLFLQRQAFKKVREKQSPPPPSLKVLTTSKSSYINSI